MTKKTVDFTGRTCSRADIGSQMVAFERNSLEAGIDQQRTTVMAKATKNAAKNATKANQKAAKAQKGRKSTPKANAPQNATGSNGNPFRVGGGYWSAVEALSDRGLGMGKMHPHAKIVPAVKKAMGKGWEAFAAKKGGKMTPEQRVLCNVMVTARDDYGRPLKDIGFEVRWDGRAKEAGLFRLGSAPKGKALASALKAKAS